MTPNPLPAFKNKRITITGGNGFLGKHLCKAFHAHGYQNILVASSSDHKFNGTIDDFVKSRKSTSNVIPAKAGIQKYQIVTEH